MTLTAYPTPITTPDPHTPRRKAMLEKHGEQIRALMGNDPRTFFWVIAVVTSQFVIAYFLREQGVITQLVAAFFVGAFFNHALYVFIHEAAHNLIFSKPLPNRLVGLLCDLPLLCPGSQAFRKYHLIHHTRFGQFEYDADICSSAEAKLVGNCPIRKTIWCFFLGISQGMRPNRIQSVPLWDRWQVLNTVIQITVIALVVTNFGWMPVIYLFGSSIFGLGLHPLGARWIAEHFLLKSDQETYSYYGPLNRFIFNVGYHVEHHDFMTIPWMNLPKLTAIAKPCYESLVSYRSYTWVIWEFIRNPKHTLYARTLRISHKDETNVTPPALVVSPVAS